MTNAISETTGTPFYTLRVNGHDLVVDGSKKGQPGDVVVVWPVKGGPLIARRLARCIPYDKYFFQTLAECRTLTMPCNKVRCPFEGDSAFNDRESQSITLSLGYSRAT